MGAGALRAGERLLVAEDSAWPTDACVPGNVQHLHVGLPRDMGLWIGAARGCANYLHAIGHGVEIKCFAPAGSKLLSGTASFWMRVNEFFVKLEKGYSTD